MPACRGCIQQSVRHRAQCPVCKAKVGRRDIYPDETMDRVVQVWRWQYSAVQCSTVGYNEVQVPEENALRSQVHAEQRPQR